jgi:hypothetical protein
MTELKLVIETDRVLGTVAVAEQVLGVLVKRDLVPERFGTFEPLRTRFEPTHPEFFVTAWADSKVGRMHAFHFEARRRYQATVICSLAEKGLDSVHFTFRAKEGDNDTVAKFLDFGVHLFDVVDGQYGHLCTREEYWSKNVTGSWVGRTGHPEGGKAHGADRTKHLPGVYWANFFGPVYASFFGENRLQSAPAYSVQRTERAWVLLTAGSPYDWRAAEAVRLERELREHLGPEAFFEIERPDRPTRAPQFRVPKQK